MRPVLVDSGSLGSFRVQAQDAIGWKVTPRPASGSVGYNSIYINKGGRAADDVQLGTVSVEQPIVEISERTRILGEQVMRRFVWTFDQRTRRGALDRRFRRTASHRIQA